MSKRKGFLFYAYNIPTSGNYKYNGYTYRYGEDFRNAKRFKEYVDCGFDMIQARGENAFRGGEWEGSNCKLVFDEALKAGCKKLLVTDSRFDQVIRQREILGEGKRFQTEEELDEWVRECVKPYCKRKGFYGIQLLDEPIYAEFPAYFSMVASLKRVLPEAYLQCNLLPLDARTSIISSDESLWKEMRPDDGLLRHATDFSGKQDVYEKYVRDFTVGTGLDSILFDEYPFRREYLISGNFLPNYQIVARLCQELGIEFRVVLQSFSHVTVGVIRNRRMGESDMYWQMNAALGFGVREFSFYTYMAKPTFEFAKDGGGEQDGSSFINLDGSNTAMWYDTKRIIKEFKRFAKIALGYEYENSYVVCEDGKTADDFDHTKYLYEKKTCPLKTKVEKGVALVTESKGEKGKLYMFENIGNVKEELFEGAKPMRFTAYLPEGKKKFYFRGKPIKVKANADGSYTFSLKVGDAVFAEVRK